MDKIIFLDIDGTINNHSLGSDSSVIRKRFNDIDTPGVDYLQQTLKI